MDSLAHVGLGLIHWDRWEPAEALQHLGIGIDRARRIGAGYVEAMAARALACIAQHQGHEQEAQTRLEEAMTASRGLDYAEAAGFADLMEAHCRIVRGDQEALERWIAGRQPLERLSPDTRVLESQVVAHARLLLDDAHGALNDLAQVREKAKAAGWTQRLVEILVLEAQAHEALGQRSQALVRLEEALDLSLRGGFTRPFVKAGENVLPLLRHLIASDLSTEQYVFVETVVDALDAEIEPSPAASELVEPLTDREMDVLRLLPTELTTAEIAERLYISYHTVRTHLKHIYGKLDAHSRHEAVTCAEDFGLL